MIMKTREMGVLIISLVLAIVGGSQALAADPDDLLAVHEAYGQALRAHNIDGMLALMTDDTVYDFALDPAPMTSKEAIRAFFEAVFVGFPDFSTTDELAIANNDTVVVEHHTTGTHLGMWLGVPPTGNNFPWAHLDIYEFEGDKIKKSATYGDLATMLMNMGVLPIPQMPELTPSFTPGTPEPSSLSPLDAVEAAQALYNAHDLAGYARMQAADDDIYVDPFGSPLSRAQFAAIQEMYFAAFSGMQMNVIRNIDMGDGWVVCECTWTSTHTGWFMGVPPSGVAVEVRGVVLYRYEQGIERYLHVYFDNMSLMQQISPKAVPLPEVADCYVEDEITSPSLEGNLLGDPATRSLLVWLPPSYETSPDRRYPTIYLLHGFLGDHRYFTSGGGVNVGISVLTGMDLGVDVNDVAEELMATGQMGEVIIVMVDALNSLGGSMYGNSVLIGDYQAYVAEDIVTYIDGKYRTIADPKHRGVGGHSMGGHGALSLAIEYPDVFGAVAALSPGINNSIVADLFLAEYPLVLGLPIVGSTSDDLWDIFLNKFNANLLYATAAAWTPNLTNPPFYVDLPVKYPEKTIVPDVMDQWVERRLPALIEKNGSNLSGKPILIDEGRGPAMLMAEVVDIDLICEALYDQGLSYTYDVFDGDHLTHLRYQLASALEFLYPHIAPCAGGMPGDLNDDCIVDCVDFAIMAADWLESTE
jgi:steroid delta-isomerase-like uncharacterized protein